MSAPGANEIARPDDENHTLGNDNDNDNETAEENGNVVWSGSWVAERLGIELVGGDELRELLGLALRRNPKRAHLLVSNVLGKHVPQRPSVVHGAGVALGERVRDLLGDAAEQAVILGYAEIGRAHV